MTPHLPHGSTSIPNVGLAIISSRAHRKRRTRFCDPHMRWWQLLAAFILLPSFHVELAQARKHAEVGQADIVGASLRALQPDGSHRQERKRKWNKIAPIDDSADGVNSPSGDAEPELNFQDSRHIGRYVNGNLEDRDLCLVAGGFVAGIAVTTLFFVLASGCGHMSAVQQTRTDMLASADGSSAVEDTKNTPTSEAHEDPEYHESLDSFWPRTLVLITMLMVQSLSSYILFLFRSLIVEHPEIIYFLTMLVGLGGNASGQSVVLSVRELAFGREVQLKRQALTGFGMGVVLAPIAYGRAYLSDTGAITVAVVIGISVLFITTAGTVIGTVLPKVFEQLEIDPGHTSPVVQVLMDMVGITIVCTVGFVVLDLAEGNNSLS